jgi:phage terminase small subunit
MSKKYAKLTPKQERFCLAYMVSGNATQAYKSIYKCALKAAESGSCRTLRIGKIAAFIQNMKDKSAKKAEVSIQSVVDDIVDTHRRAKDKGGEYTAELKASDMLMKHVGGYEKDNEQQNTDLTGLLAALDGQSRGLPSK